MRQDFTLRGRALTTASFMGIACALATPAFAQDTAGQPPELPACDPSNPNDTNCRPVDAAGGEPGPSGSVTVTGSRIRRPNVESNVPVTSVSAEELTAQGDVNIGDALNDLPSIRSTFSQANSTRFIGTTGLNLLDLRGLGTVRTLVLVNGRRHITSSPGDFLVDVNTIPTDLLERVDVVTGGSSAVYGSDAIAGVVNFVTRRDFEGVRLRAQGGISERADRGIYFASLTAGENFLDDRLNIAVNLEYVHAEPLFFSQRDEISGAFSGRCQLNLAEFTAGEPAAGDGVPDNAFFCGVRNGTLSDGGTFLAANPTVRFRDRTGPAGVPDGVIDVRDNEALACTNNLLAPGGQFAALGTQRCINPGTAQGVNRIFRFNSGGQVIQDIPAFDFRPFGSGNIISSPGQPDDARGSTLRNTGQFAPGLDRYQANLLMRFDVSPAFQPFLEAKFVHLESLQEGQPSFFSSVAQTIGAPNIRCDNAFLQADDIAALRANGICNADPVAGAAGAFNPNGTIPLNRFNVDFGGRSEFVTRETIRVVGGVGGEFNGDWNYEISFNYGQFEQSSEARNNLILTDVDGNFDGFLLAYNSVLVNGTPTCRVNADADPSNNRPDCVPIDLFGGGRPSQAALDFVNTTSFLDQSATQYNVVGFVNGDLSQLFEFPGGPVRFVIGGEFRREEAFLQADELSAAGGTFFNAFATFDPPPLEVYEAFGEIELPLLRDMPFAHELTLTAAARVSDYNTAAGQTFAYNFNGTWAPISSFRFRGNYSRSVRVPTLSDLFFPATQNFAFIADPCDTLNINAGPNRAANCRALGVPVDQPGGFVNTPARTASTEFVSSGNELLEEESSDSYTVGFVFTPEFIPGLSVTVDYYNITVDNLIAALTPQVILNQCVDQPTINNQFCALAFPRNADGTFASPAVISAGVNFARQEAEGVDFEVAYRRRFDNGMRLDLRGILTYVIERNNFVNPVNPDIGTPQLLALGDPQLAANFTAAVGTGPFDLRYTMNYIGEQLVAGGIDTYFGFQGRPPTNADVTAEVFYPDTFYHNLRLSFRVNERFQFYMGADNIFDTAPPLGLQGNEGGVPFDNIGRYFYAGAQVDF